MLMLVRDRMAVDKIQTVQKVSYASDYTLSLEVDKLSLFIVLRFINKKINFQTHFILHEM